MIVRGPAAPRALTQSSYDKIRKKKKGKVSHIEWRKKRVECRICGKVMQNASLKRHMKQQHGEQGDVYICREIEEARDYTMKVTKGRFNKCPIVGCSGGGKDKYGIYRHFCLRHPTANIQIEGDGILPKCELCGMRTKNVEKHKKSPTCLKARKRRGNEIRQDLQAEAEKVEFRVNGKKLKRVKEFRYLGRILTENDNDTRCITDNLSKARLRWGQIAKLLKREGAGAKCMGKFYLAVVQSVLLYGAESWVISNRDMLRLRSFHRRAVRYMNNDHIRKVGEGQWETPDHSQLELNCGLFSIETYIERKRGTLRKYLEEFRADLLREAEVEARHSQDAHKILWWEQKWINKEEMTELKNFWFK